MSFRNKKLDDQTVKELLGLSENYAWRVSQARKELMEVDRWETYFSSILYRPFNTRHIYFHKSVVWRPRFDVMRQF